MNDWTKTPESEYRRRAMLAMNNRVASTEAIEAREKRRLADEQFAAQMGVRISYSDIEPMCRWDRSKS